MVCPLLVVPTLVVAALSASHAERTSRASSWLSLGAGAGSAFMAGRGGRGGNMARAVAEEAHGESPVALGGGDAAGKFRAAGGVCGCQLVAAAAGDEIMAEATGPARCGAGVPAVGGGIKSAATGAAAGGRTRSSAG